MTAGISFICRVAKGDDTTLTQSIASMRGLTIPHELVVLSAVTEDAGGVYQYDGEISRAGYETLITPASSPHSLPSFLQWCIRQGIYTWSFRWDADFIASPELIEFLNSRGWNDDTPTRIRFPQSSDNNEPVLFNAGHEYVKHIFWEVNRSIFHPNVREEISSATIRHASAIADIKSYWREPPWFARLDTPEAAELRRKYNVLVDLLGPEPIGLARAGNPICDEYEYTVRANEHLLADHGINLYV